MRTSRKHNGQAYVKCEPVRVFEWLAYSTTTGNFQPKPTVAPVITHRRTRSATINY